MAKKERLIRLGRVSSIDYDNGMMRVTYPDLDDCVTAPLPVFAGTGEYKMPAIGDEVLVVHLSAGQNAGVVLGRYWNKKNTPPVSGAGIYRKELGAAAGEAYIDYDGENITFHDPSGTITLKEIIALTEG